MTATHQTMPDRRRQITGALLVAAGAGGLGLAAPANAVADKYISLSYSLQSNVSGVAVTGDASSANSASLQNCVANGGNQCVTYVNVKNACAALAIGVDPVSQQEWSSATADLLKTAQNMALANNGGGRIGVSGCATSLQIDPQPQSPPGPVPPPAAPPKLGPGVSWDPRIGGLTAHINDRSGVASQCMYTTDFYERGFFLPANATYDLVIVPAIPRFKNWDVTIACDNGTSTQTSKFF